MFVKKLIEMVPPPAEPTEVSSLSKFREAEKDFGSPFPSDYKDFVLAYGTGVFASFYKVFTPFTQRKGQKILEHGRQLCEYERESQKQFGRGRFPYDLYPDVPGIYPWACDENGNSYWWLIEGDPNKWTVVENEVRGDGYKHHHCSMSEFLVQILTHQIEALAGDYPTLEDYHFKPLHPKPS